MKKLITIAILGLAISPLVNIVQAKESLQSAAFYQVPFKNVEIKGGQKIRASYKFNTDQMLVCTQSTDELESIEWQYKDVWYKGQMPLTLMDNIEFQGKGQYADPDGTLIITNEFGDLNDGSPMIVSCEYRNMK